MASAVSPRLGVSGEFGVYAGKKSGDGNPRQISYIFKGVIIYARIYLIRSLPFPVLTKPLSTLRIDLQAEECPVKL